MLDKIKEAINRHEYLEKVSINRIDINELNDISIENEPILVLVFKKSGVTDEVREDISKNFSLIEIKNLKIGTDVDVTEAIDTTYKNFLKNLDKKMEIKGILTMKERLFKKEYEELNNELKKLRKESWKK